MSPNVPKINSIFIFGHKKAEKGIFAYFSRMHGQKKAKNEKIEKRKSYFF